MRATLSALSLFLSAHSLAFAADVDWKDDPIDVCFSESPGKSGYGTKLGPLLYNDQIIGAGEVGFETIVNRIKQLPRGSSIVWGPDPSKCKDCNQRFPGPNPFQQKYPKVWDELLQVVRFNGLSLSSTYPSPTVRRPRWKGKVQTDELELQWLNYHGPTTPEDQVLYAVNGLYLGHGDEGFEAVLDCVREAAPGDTLVIPHYEYAPWKPARPAKYMFDSQSGNDPRQQKSRQINAVLARVFPFAPRKGELDRLVKSCRLRTNSPTITPANDLPTTVFDWRAGDMLGETFFSFGRLVRYGEKASPPAAKVGWTDYDAVQLKPRQHESTAVYTIDHRPIGEGFPGFVQVLHELLKLPEGSVVHVQVCLRTDGPFEHPILFEKTRHYERTGYEPYFGLFQGLLNVARIRQLHLEWIPDEGRPLAEAPH